MYFSAGDGAADSRLWAACLGGPAVPLVSFTHGTSSPGSPPQNICTFLPAEKIKFPDEGKLYIHKLCYKSELFLIYKEIQMGAVASHVWGIAKIFNHIWGLRRQLVIYYFANRSLLNFLIYEENSLLFFISVCTVFVSENVFTKQRCPWISR